MGRAKYKQVTAEAVTTVLDSEHCECQAERTADTVPFKERCVKVSDAK